MTYHAALGTEKEEADSLLPTTTGRVAGGSYVNMSVCNLQRRLKTAGKSVGLDGKYGPNTETALRSFITATVPAVIARRVVAYPAVLPPLNTRDDYRASADKTHVTIPADYHSWIMLKAPSAQQCTGGGGGGSSPRPAPDATPSDTPDSDVTDNSGAGTGTGVGVWPWLLIAAAAAAGGGYYWWRKRKYPGT